MISDAAISSIVNSLPTTIAAVTAAVAAFAALMQVKNTARKTQDDALRAHEDAKNTNEKADALVRKTDEIHVLTNSNLSSVTRQLEIANTKIEGLERLIRSMVPPVPLTKQGEGEIATIVALEEEKNKA